MNVEFALNGVPTRIDVEPETMLLEVLHDELGLTGARDTWGVGLCGACTVLVDGAATSAFILMVPLAAGRQVATIEGVDEDDSVAESFDRHHAYQCGYCIPVMVLTVKAMLTEGACGSRGQITEGLGGNLCRYGWYVKIVDAIEECAR